MKKNPQNDPDKNERSPRTEQDERFLALASQIMNNKHISSERAFSLELGRGPDFISRIRRGIQSAPADAWDALLTKYPEAHNITNNSASTKEGPAVANVEGNATFTMNDCKRELESARQQLADKDKLVTSQEKTIASLEKTVASLEEILGLLRGGSNRPN